MRFLINTGIRMVYQKRQHCSQWEERKDTVRIGWPLMGQRWAKLAGLTAKPHTVALQVTLPSAAWLFLKSTLVVDRRQLPQKVFHSLGETGCEGSFTRSLPSCSIFPLFRDWGLLLPPSPPLPFAKPLTAVWGKFLESTTEPSSSLTYTKALLVEKTFTY